MMFKIKIFNLSKQFKFINLIFLLVCSVVGVGFISGAEIYEVFVRFGDFCWVGVIVFFVLIFYLTNKIINESNDNEKLLKMYKNTNFNIKNAFYYKLKVKSILLFFNVLIMSGAMISGLRELLSNLFFHNYYIMFFVCVFVAFFVLLKGVQGLQKLDYFVLLFIVFIVANLCYETKTNILIENPSNNYNNITNLSCVLFTILYVFMNILHIKPILLEFKYKLTKRNSLVLSLCFSFILVLLLIILIIVLRNNMWLSEYSMPFLEFFKRKGGGWLVLFSLTLIFALISSLLASMIGVKRVLLNKTNNFYSTVFSVVFALLIGVFDFSFYVTYVYPVVGFINFVIFLFL